MQAGIAADIALHTLRANTDADIDGPTLSFGLVNDAIATMELSNDWRWLRRDAAPLSLIKNQPWIDLPVDLRKLIDISPVKGILNRLMPVTQTELLELRNSSLQDVGFSYYWAVEFAPRLNKNLLSFTETFSDAVWEATGVTVTDNAAVAPDGRTRADTLTATATSDNVRQDVTGVFEHGRDFVASLYVKASAANPSAQTDIALRQQGTGGTPETASNVPSTVVRLAWAAGVPTATLQSSSGLGSHNYGVDAIADGWYRVYLTITHDENLALPGGELTVQVYPDTAAGTDNVDVWGAQLEAYRTTNEDLLSRPTRYSPNAAAFAAATGPPVQRLAIWPTPKDDAPQVFNCHYSRSLPRVAITTDEIELPVVLEPLFKQVVRLHARAYYEEDEGWLEQRLEGLYASRMWAKAVADDGTYQMKFGPLRGVAGMQGTRTRDWGSNTLVPTPE